MINNYQPNYITINGYQIKNEKEAMELTQYTLQILFNKMATTTQHTQTVTEIIEF